MIAGDHAAFPFLGVARPDKKVVRDLNFHWAWGRRDTAEGCTVEDVAALCADDLPRLKFFRRKESRP